jgi:hypothetical protein
MTADNIYKALAEIRDKFPKSSKMFLGLIEPAGATGAFEGTTQRAAVISMKSAWQLEDKTPTKNFSPTDESVIGYVRSVAENASQSAIKVMVVIDLSKDVTSVWVVPKGMCFIATAACGNPTAPEVIALSEFRDDTLLQSHTGKLIVRMYYRISPRIADIIVRSRFLRRATMTLIVSPAVKLVQRFAR